MPATYRVNDFTLHAAPEKIFVNVVFNWLIQYRANIIKCRWNFIFWGFTMFLYFSRGKGELYEYIFMLNPRTHQNDYVQLHVYHLSRQNLSLALLSTSSTLISVVVAVKE